MADEHQPGSVRTLRLVAISYAASQINLFDFRPVGSDQLPPFTAGAHVDLHLPNGLVRQYSLCNSADERHRYVVGIKRDGTGRGGSRCAHDELRVGALVPVGGPRNNFALDEGAAHTVLVAGGIGITPIACMARRLEVLGRSWELHYGVRHREEAAFLADMRADRVHLHVDAEHGGSPMAIGAIVQGACPDAHLYCCGPGPMLDAFESAAQLRDGRTIHLERFSSAAPAATAGGYEVTLARSQRHVQVAPGQSLLIALRTAGIDVPTSCEQGVCGTCETRVLNGTPDHRDSLLSESEKAANDVMMICCSGSKGARLTLDL